MWADNFKKYLYDRVEASDGYTLEQAERALQAYFKELMAGARPSKDNDTIFYKIRNGALYMLKTRFNDEVENVLNRSYTLGVAKNTDYGTSNIPKYGVVGIVVRLNDKISRAMYLLKSGASAAMVQDEKTEDTIMDMVNYTTYAIMLCNGVWE